MDHVILIWFQLWKLIQKFIKHLIQVQHIYGLQETLQKLLPLSQLKPQSTG